MRRIHLFEFQIQNALSFPLMMPRKLRGLYLANAQNAAHVNEGCNSS